MPKQNPVKDYIEKTSPYGDIYCPNCGLECDITTNTYDGEPYLIVKSCKKCQMIDFGDGWEKGYVAQPLRVRAHHIQCQQGSI